MSAHRQVCVAVLCVLFTSLACAASDDPPRYEFTIPAGLPLDEALQRFARQSDTQVLFFSQVAEGYTAPGVNGEYTPIAAMTRLLEGSGLTFRHINERTIGVEQQAQRQSVSPKSAPNVEGPMEEVHVVARAEQLVATRIPTLLRDIPQSVSVVSSEQIRQQNSVDLGDVLRNAPGLATRRANSLEESAYSRSFAVTSYHVDGGGALKPSFDALNLYTGTPDLSEFDRVEVLRGSDALFAGNSNPGATVSLVRKRPLRTPALNVSATLGSWNNYRVELDATGPLVEDASLRGRMDAVYATRDYFFDRAFLDRKKIFAAVEYDLTPTATVTAGGSYQWDEGRPLVDGFPLYSDGSDPHLPRETSLVFDWSFTNTRAGNAYVQYQQKFNENWALKLNASAGRTRIRFGYGSFDLWIDKKTDTLSSPGATFDTRPDRYSLSTVDATLTGTLGLFGLREVFAVGGDYTRVTGRLAAARYTGFGPAQTHVSTFDPAAYPDPRLALKPLLEVDTREVSEQYGVFLSMQVDVSDAWSLTVGARRASDTHRLSGRLFISGIELPTSPNETGSSPVITPFAALLFRMSDHLSWYASYADIYLSPASGRPVRADGSVVGPAHGVTLETGIKGAWLNNTVNASAIAYRVDQWHLTVPDDTVSSTSPNCCFVNGTARSRGAELQVDGELAPGWLIGSGYTYNKTESAYGGVPSTSTPRHLLKIWTSKRLPDPLSRWTAGGSLRAQAGARGSLVYRCSQTSCPATEALSQRDYAVLDLRTEFDVDANWRVALNVNNVFDKRYFLSQNSPALQAWYGDPRNFMVRIDARF